MRTGFFHERNQRSASTREDRSGLARLQDGTLVIECQSCRGDQDLTDPGCMRCALTATGKAPSCTRLLLSRNLDVAYEGRSVVVIRELAEVVGMCRTRTVLAQDRSCTGCSSRPSLVLERLASSIPYDFGPHAPTTRPLQGRAKCLSCVSQTNDVISTVMAKLRSIERSISKEAFMVVGESGNA